MKRPSTAYSLDVWFGVYSSSSSIAGHCPPRQTSAHDAYSRPTTNEKTSVAPRAVARTRTGWFFLNVANRPRDLPRGWPRGAGGDMIEMYQLPRATYLCRMPTKTDLIEE